ncbi:MAG TPA: hypothetical protein ENI05_14065 [Porticoccus sp.]|nr:hypothetical protein [Porticoccus sp.]
MVARPGNIQRNRGRRMMLVEPSFEESNNAIADMDWLHLQELANAVALATNSALALGRNTAGLTFADYVIVQAGWSHLGGEVVRCDGSQIGNTTLSQPGVYNNGDTVEFTSTISNYGAGQITSRLQGAFGTTRSGNNTLTETIVAGAGATSGWVANVDFIGDIDLKTVTFKQTDIAASSVYAPGTNPMDFANTGMSIGNPGAGNVEFIYLGDGATTGLETATIAEWNSKFNPDKLTMMLVVRVDDWSAGTDVIWRLAVDANTEAVLERRGSTLAWRYRVGGNTNEVTFDTAALPGGSPDGLFTMVMTVDTDGAGEIIGYMNGIARGTTTITGSWVGNFDPDECGVFAADAIQTASLDGGGAHVGLGYRVLSPVEIYDYHVRSGL